MYHKCNGRRFCRRLLKAATRFCKVAENMGLAADRLKSGLDAIAAAEPAMARALEIAGYPEPRIRPTGYATPLRTIVGDRKSVAAAASVWAKLEALLGDRKSTRLNSNH